MRAHVLLLLPFLLAAIAPFRHAEATEARKALVGGWQPIDNLNDPHVTEIAKFALLAQSSDPRMRLVFIKVLRGETQVVSGVNYRLVVEAKDVILGIVTDYEAVVWEKAWENFRRLTCFKPATRGQQACK